MTGDVRLIRSPISVAGMVLTTISAVVFLVVFLADLFGLHTNPYLGIVFFVVVPALFLAGLLLIPLGAWIERRRRAAGKPPSAMQWPRVDLNDARQRRITVLVFALTMANIVIVSLAAYGGVEYMDSVAFCTQVCHPMKPELRAHRQGPHVQRPLRGLPRRAGRVGLRRGQDRRVPGSSSRSPSGPIPVRSPPRRTSSCRRARPASAVTSPAPITARSCAALSSSAMTRRTPGR